jgi:hypothetical protein
MHKGYNSDSHTGEGALWRFSVLKKIIYFMRMIASRSDRTDHIYVSKVRVPNRSKHLDCAWYKENVTKAAYMVQNGKLLSCAGTKELRSSALTLRQHTGELEKMPSGPA